MPSAPGAKFPRLQPCIPKRTLAQVGQHPLVDRVLGDLGLQTCIGCFPGGWASPILALGSGMPTPRSQFALSTEFR